LLLGVAVILPTVCLLWFMSQAVKNERLAVRQKLIDSYTSRAQEIFFKDPEIAIEDPNEFSASIIYDQNDKLIYPFRTNQTANFPAYNIEKAWELEYVDKNYDEAIKQYDSISLLSSIVEITYDCKIAVVRCLIKQKKTTEAIEKCRQLVYPSPDTLPIPPIHSAYARLMLIDLYSKTNHPDVLKELQNQLSQIEVKPSISTETKIFVLGELIKLAQKSGLIEKLKSEIEKTQKIINSASLSIMAADYFDADIAAQGKPDKTFYKIQTTPPLYCIKFKNDDKKTVNLLTAEKMKQLWQSSVDDFTDELIFCRILDNTGQIIAGQPEMWLGGKYSQGQKFLTRSLGKFFPDWQVELYFRYGIFTAAARRQQMIYTWTAILVIGLMVVLAGVAGKTVARQVKLNKLKNDFIATVSHELKTPLSSMRVLVDTLLDGNYEGEKTAAEYLQLVSKENERLSRLIDNFLTFSRMERNKQAFDIGPAEPAEIAKAAVDAVQTKFGKARCKFDVSIDENLPQVPADKDAMVTVLLNLLDNAYKYSYDDKQIELKVFAEEDKVCFSVKDNGIGMGRRAVKKIFNRFYQVDSSLSRSAEGTGLGLAIVKFIVDAHKGQITVESKPDEGSEFVVKMPIVGK